jgi:hypothetical protein
MKISKVQFCATRASRAGMTEKSPNGGFSIRLASKEIKGLLMVFYRAQPLFRTELQSRFWTNQFIWLRKPLWLRTT